jgi:hypothetical protein
MKQQIEEALRPLSGLKLSSMWRALGIQIFEFGEQLPTQNIHGDSITRANCSIDVTCPWRIIQSNTIIIASWDYLDDEKDRPDDVLSDTFFQKMKNGDLRVENIKITSVGDIFMNITNQYQLEILPMSSLDDDEHWRLITDRLKELDQHFVVIGAGIE